MNEKATRLRSATLLGGLLPRSLLRTARALDRFRTDCILANADPEWWTRQARWMASQSPRPFLEVLDEAREWMLRDPYHNGGHPKHDEAADG